MMHISSLFILDEPTSGLDPDEREMMLNRIRVLARAHQKSIVICTHILPDVQQVSDFVVILASGRVSVAKEMSELARPAVPALQVRILGSPDNFLAALKARNLDAKLGPLGTIIVDGDSAERLRQIWTIAAELDVVVRSLTPARNSMEAIFLEAVQTTPKGAFNADT